MAASTLTTKGRITIPKEVRDRLGVRGGDRIVFQFDEQDRLILRPESRKGPQVFSSLCQGPSCDSAEPHHSARRLTAGSVLAAERAGT
jgi:AbrB family looped-hinge helix DNA binding protein